MGQERFVLLKKFIRVQSLSCVATENVIHVANELSHNSSIGLVIQAPWCKDLGRQNQVDEIFADWFRFGFEIRSHLGRNEMLLEVYLYANIGKSTVDIFFRLYANLLVLFFSGNRR